MYKQIITIAKVLLNDNLYSIMKVTTLCYIFDIKEYEYINPATLNVIFIQK